MRHLGDITKISGYDTPMVDVIIGGSPCQDLSVAGKRAGLEGERSHLFLEQIRIIKEMRDRDVRVNGRSDESIRPRYMVWENVCGAFSSPKGNKGEDFRVVLEETAKIADPTVSVPRPAKGKWTKAGCIMGDGWSIAWRVFDAQYWGVPQRRKRIALVADFGGQSAPEILFIRNRLQGNHNESRETRKDSSTDTPRGFGANDSLGADQYNAIILGDKVSTLGINCGMSHGRQCVLEPAFSVENHPNDSRVGINEDGKVQALTGRMGTGGGNVPLVMSLDRASFNQGKNAQFDIGIDDKGVAHTVVAKGPSAVCYAVDQGGGKSSCGVTEGIAPTLTCTHGGEPAACYGFYPQMKAESNCFIEDKANTIVNGTCPGHHNGVVVAVDCRNATESDTTGALQSVSAHSLNGNNVVRIRYIVRRLTPLECERLQGYPDLWTDIGEYIDSKGKKCKSSDAARYKALGNSIALPSWKWVLKKLSAQYERDATMASLFSGIGGFDLIWTQINGKDSVLWEAEIEDFPSAVTKRHFGNEDTGEKGDFYEAILGRNKT